jgi:flavin-dependent dehydrogenase
VNSVLVLGGGPAGCAAALLLARWGHDVELVTRPARSSTLAESLTPSCGKLFDLLGITDAVDAAGFVRSTGNTVWWGSDETRVEPFAGDARGWQANTAALEHVLLDCVRRAGITVVERTLTAEDAARVPAAVRLDCTGRVGLLARSVAGRRYEEGHRTVALACAWTRRAWPVPDPSHTLIESYADGWAWSVPLDGTRRSVAVMVDPRTTVMTRGAGARTTYLAEIGKTRRLASLLADAIMEGEPIGWDASTYSSESYAGNDWLLVGDAASFVDPLSSAGVRKALGSGWLAAICTHTGLVKPEMAETARAFFAAREAEVFSGFLALTRQFHAVAAQGQPHAFWTDRAEPGPPPSLSPEVSADAVRAAHERLRRAPEIRLRASRDVTIEPRPAIGGAEIVMEPRMVARDMPAGIRFLHDVDVVTLVSLASEYRQVPDLYEACVRRAGPVGLSPFLTTLATAVARGWLVED